MAGSRPQSHGDAINMENNLQLSTTLVRFYQQQQLQEQLLQQQQQLQIMQQPQQYYINENQSCDDEDLDETNRIENSFINENRQLLETIKSTKKDYDVDMFINEMREYPCIWNTSLRSYHDQIIRKNAWDELSKKFGCLDKELLTIIL